MSIMKFKFDADSESVEQKEKQISQKSYGPTTYSHRNKNKNIHFSITFCLVTFFACIFATFSMDSKINIKFCVFDTLIEFGTFCLF